MNSENVCENYCRSQGTNKLRNNDVTGSQCIAIRVCGWTKLGGLVVRTKKDCQKNLNKMGIQEHLDYYWNQDVDPRIKDLPLIESNYLIPSIAIVYLYFVLKWGPNYMKDRKPYNLNTFTRYYNIFQILLNGYAIIRYIQLGILDEPTKICHPMDYSLDPISVQIVYTVWLGWFTRLADLMETVTFVLKKKDKQVSFLHVYHHLTVTLLGWYMIRYYVNQFIAVHALVNSIVHVIMYTYYYFTTFGDNAPKILRSIKPHITKIQMVQFIILMIHILAILQNCTLPTKVPAYVNMGNLIMNFILFYKFYRKTYSDQQKHKE